MTEQLRCRWCRMVLPERAGPGRKRQFCSGRCRQWEWVSKQRSAELELSDGELVIARTELDQLRDDLYVLSCAIEDAERDLEAYAGKADARELREVLDWVLDAAKPLRDRQISAPTVPTSKTS